MHNLLYFVVSQSCIFICLHSIISPLVLPWPFCLAFTLIIQKYISPNPTITMGNETGNQTWFCLLPCHKYNTINLSKCAGDIECAGREEVRETVMFSACASASYDCTEHELLGRHEQNCEIGVILHINMKIFVQHLSKFFLLKRFFLFFFCLNMNSSQSVTFALPFFFFSALRISHYLLIILVQISLHSRTLFIAEKR